MKPWTKDEILMDYKFCNVRRMDDRVSIWLAENWYNSKATNFTLLIMGCMARMINWPDTLACLKMGQAARLEQSWDPKWIKKTLNKRKKSGEKIFTGAYIINGARGGSKIIQVVDNINFIAKDFHSIKENIREHDMRELWALLLDYPGIGTFIAGQIVADLRHVGFFKSPNDCMEWAPLGPGSKRGMWKLTGNKPNQKTFEILLPELVCDVYQELPEIAKDRQLEAMDIQNSLCEFDKYTRLEQGGHVKNKYPGRPEYA